MQSLNMFLNFARLSIPTHSSEVDIQRSSSGEGFRGASTYSGAPGDHQMSQASVLTIAPDNND